MVEKISTGIRYLDQVTGGLRLGDNVVWEITSGVPVEYFIKGFFDGNEQFRSAVIIISFNVSPYTVLKRYAFLLPRFRVTLIDAFTRGKGNGDPVFLDFYQEPQGVNAVLLENPRDRGQFMEVLNVVESENRDGSFYIFDSLTGMNELWKDEGGVLDFFNFTCPKLYDLNTLAYWMLERDAHSREFLAGLIHTTQVVFSLSPARADHYKLSIRKLQGRPSSGDPGPHLFTLSDGAIAFRDRRHEGVLGIGERVKELRRTSGMTQTELASRTGMTPGAVSQIENEITVPSLNTLMQLSVIFGRPVDYFLGNEGGIARAGYSVFEESPVLPAQETGVSVARLADHPGLGFLPHLVVLEGGAVIDGALLLHRGAEFISVIGGSVALTIEGEEIVLSAGKSVMLSGPFPERWRAGGEGCRLYYILMQRREIRG
ncbi:MAG: helix-turn-helix domain-containing protein [Spirochaetes bacterium]|nr:helix-turn-helix domain-containing protein [Spirochaetota bacterium]